MTSSNDKTFEWSVKDIRDLDARLSRIESSIEAGVNAINELKTEVENKNHIVIDNSKQSDYKAITILIGSAVAAGLAVWAQISQ